MRKNLTYTFIFFVTLGLVFSIHLQVFPQAQTFITVALKLIVYFLFFHPQFQLDGTVTRNEFFMFFVPYALGLLAEIIFLARRFN